jgi:hypothetical protein
MRKYLFLALAPALVLGCSRFSATQIDSSDSGRTITTKVSGVTWFSSAQHITGVKLSQTDKTQSFNTSAIGQQGDTNMIEKLSAVARIVEALRPTP